MALAVWAPRPATRPFHSLAHLIDTDLDAAGSGFGFFGRNDPADPFVTSQRSKRPPKAICQTISSDRFLKVIRQLVHNGSNNSPRDRLSQVET
jgi:hypothetical protein